MLNEILFYQSKDNWKQIHWIIYWVLCELFIFSCYTLCQNFLIFFYFSFSITFISDRKTEQDNTKWGEKESDGYIQIELSSKFSCIWCILALSNQKKELKEFNRYPTYDREQFSDSWAKTGVSTKCASQLLVSVGR